MDTQLPSHITINPDGSATYVVQPGDNLSSISRYFSDSPSNYNIIVKDNNITNANVIVVGQVLTINKSIVTNERLVAYVKQLNSTYGTSTGTNGSTATPSTPADGSGEGLSLEVDKVKSLLRTELNQDFSKLHTDLANLVSRLDELQNVFYGPDDSDCTLIYKELSKIIGNDTAKTGLIGNVVTAHDWCEAVDKYITDFERITNSGQV